MIRFLLLCTLILTTGCANTPIRMYHNYGELPKIKIHLPDNYGEVKVRAKRSEVKFIWKRRI